MHCRLGRNRPDAGSSLSGAVHAGNRGLVGQSRRVRYAGMEGRRPCRRTLERFGHCAGRTLYAGGRISRGRSAAKAGAKLAAPWDIRYAVDPHLSAGAHRRRHAADGASHRHCRTRAAQRRERRLAQQLRSPQRNPADTQGVAHDPEKWVPVFPRDKRGTRLRGDHAQTRVLAMAYDEVAAERVRKLLAGRSDVFEQKLMGGLCFMVRGHMCCAVSGRGGLLVRVGPDAPASVLGEPHCAPVEMRGRVMTGYVRVAPEGYETAAGLKKRVMRAVDFVDTLAKPREEAAKKTKAKAAKPRKK